VANAFQNLQYTSNTHCPKRMANITHLFPAARLIFILNGTYASQFFWKIKQKTLDLIHVTDKDSISEQIIHKTICMRTVTCRLLKGV